MFHIAMTPAQVSNLPEDTDFVRAWGEINNILSMPVITMEEIEAMEVPGDEMYVPWRGTLDGVPSSGRVVRSRDGSYTVTVDVRHDTARLRELQRILEQRVGRQFIARDIFGVEA